MPYVVHFEWPPHLQLLIELRHLRPEPACLCLHQPVRLLQFPQVVRLHGDESNTERWAYMHHLIPVGELPNLCLYSILLDLCCKEDMAPEGTAALMTRNVYFWHH